CWYGRGVSRNVVGSWAIASIPCAPRLVMMGTNTPCVRAPLTHPWHLGLRRCHCATGRRRPPPRRAARHRPPGAAAGGGDRAAPAHAGLPRPVVDVIFAGADAVGTEGGQCRVRRSSDVEPGMRVERRLVGPEFECDERIGVQSALKDLELLAAGFLLHGTAAVSHRLGEFGTLPGLGRRGDDETDRHGPFLSCRA